MHDIILAFWGKRHEIDAQAENLTEHLIQSNSFGSQKANETENVFSEESLGMCFQNIMKPADKEWGGFGKAPKFPQTYIIQFLLRYYYSSKNEQALEQAVLSLDKMIEGGIYDQAGGGFARYSTDTEWLVPHFEKMLYDNALLVSVLSEAYQLTGKERYKEVIDETMQFVQKELLHPQKAFYAALDADSEGEEGKFYVWTYEEVKNILEDDSEIFCEYYDISPGGNWSEGTPSEEGKNILRVKEPLERFYLKKNITVDELNGLLKRGKKKLLEQRNKRIRPSLDDKIILGWNALMNTACSKAFAATGYIPYRELAIENMKFILQNFTMGNANEFHHTWKNGIAKYPAFLDDYAFLIEALIHLQEITADRQWLAKAKSITHFVIENFNEQESGFFFYTKSGQPDVIIRKKEVYDGAVPSGNSVMAYNLYHLSIFFDNKEWNQKSLTVLSLLAKAIVQYPSSFANWACLLQEIVGGTSEIALLGDNYESLHIDLLKQYIPHRILMASATPDPDFSLLVDKPITKPASIWLCRNFTCKPPVTTVRELISLINNPNHS